MHCLGEMENIYTTLWQIYSEQHVQNVIRIYEVW